MTYDPVNDYIYAANAGIGTVSVIDGGYDPDNGNIYVGVHGGNYVSVIDGSDNQVLGTINVGSGPVTPVYDPVHHNVYVTNY